MLKVSCWVSTLRFFPHFKFLLPVLTVIESQDIRQQAAGDLFDFVFRNIGVVDQFLFSSQVDLREDLTCVSTCMLLMNGPPV